MSRAKQSETVALAKVRLPTSPACFNSLIYRRRTFPNVFIAFSPYNNKLFHTK